MIGLDQNTINVDIPESIYPLVLQPDFVQIYQDQTLIFEGKIQFDTVTGKATINIISARKVFDEIFRSPRKYLPFTFRFLHFIDNHPLDTIIVNSHICRSGVICGYVRKYGVRARETLSFECNRTVNSSNEKNFDASEFEVIIFVKKSFFFYFLKCLLILRMYLILNHKIFLKSLCFNREIV